MGRLRQSKVAEIKALWQQNYTIAEISEKTHVSRGTVSKYTRQWEAAAPTPLGGTASSLLETVVKSYLELLVCLDVSIYLDKNDLSDLIHEQALRLVEKIAAIDKEFAGKLLNNNPFLEHLRQGDVLNLRISDNELDPESLKRRRQWITLLKNFPQSLTEFV